jgi:hypothetical protein
MPRTSVALTALTLNDGVVSGATAVDPTNGHTIPVGGETSNIVLEVNNTAGASKNVTIKAGNNPPALRSGIGDKVIAVTNGTRKLITVESARFVQADGAIYVDLEAAITGTIAAYQIPAGQGV